MENLHHQALNFWVIKWSADLRPSWPQAKQGDLRTGSFNQTTLCFPWGLVEVFVQSSSGREISRSKAKPISNWRWGSPDRSFFQPNEILFSLKPCNSLYSVFGWSRVGQSQAKLISSYRWSPLGKIGRGSGRSIVESNTVLFFLKSCNILRLVSILDRLLDQKPRRTAALVRSTTLVTRLFSHWLENFFRATMPILFDPYCDIYNNDAFFRPPLFGAERLLCFFTLQQVCRHGLPFLLHGCYIIDSKISFGQPCSRPIFF